MLKHAAAIILCNFRFTETNAFQIGCPHVKKRTVYRSLPVPEWQVAFVTDTKEHGLLIERDDIAAIWVSPHIDDGCSDRVRRTVRRMYCRGAVGGERYAYAGTDSLDTNLARDLPRMIYP